ncbi:MULTISPECIES: MurR/RpiR family transcriptional regulator [unclassified Knoellia]|uniref:MurR/RpiR family transcriptional regulator n=1 Tax=Knoellia altitudinis TaxID=3404795 RepID=UPI0036109D9A
MTVRTAIQNCTATLTPADRAIADALLSRPDDVQGLTARRLGDVLGLHESAVVRFSQKVGYRGYKELRAQLTRDQVALDRPSLAGKGERSSLSEVARTQARILDELTETISQESLDAAAAMLGRARHVYVVGSGLMEPLAAFSERKFSLLGLATTGVRVSGPDLAERLSAVRDDDAILVFAFGEEAARIAAVLIRLGAQSRSMLVTDESALALGGLPDHVFTLPRATVQHGVLVPALVLAYALEYALIRHDPSRVGESEARVHVLKRSLLEQG